MTDTYDNYINGINTVLNCILPTDADYLAILTLQGRLAQAVLEIRQFGTSEGTRVEIAKVTTELDRLCLIHLQKPFRELCSFHLPELKSKPNIDLPQQPKEWSVGHPLAFLDKTLTEVIQWIYSFQREDGSFPSDRQDTYSCTWTTVRILWALQTTGIPITTERLRRFLLWLLGNQNDDGGLAFICKGDPSITDASCQYIIQLIEGLKFLPAQEISNHLERCFRWLIEHQAKEGGWNWNPARDPTPMVFSSSLAIIALLKSLPFNHNPDLFASFEKGINWLLKTQNTDGGWGSYVGDVSHPATTAMALWALSQVQEAGENIGVSLNKGTFYLISHQQPDGSWRNTIERSTGITITRLSVPLCLIALLYCGYDPTSKEILKGFSALMKSYQDGRFYYEESGIFTWPTADGLMALATLATHLSLPQILKLIDSYLDANAKLQLLQKDQYSSDFLLLGPTEKKDE